MVIIYLTAKPASRIFCIRILNDGENWPK